MVCFDRFTICTICMTLFASVTIQDGDNKGTCVNKCPSNWLVSHYSNQCWYHDPYSIMTFNQVKLGCESMHEDARIANVIEEKAMHHILKHPGLHEIWVGLKRNYYKGVEFMDMYGHVVLQCNNILKCHPFKKGPSYIPWAQNQPSSDSNVLCVYLNNSQFYSLDCDKRMAIYCTLDHCGSPIGQACAGDYKCSKKTPMSICKNYVCSCADLYYHEDEGCLPGKPLGTVCKKDKECNALSNLTECRDGMCGCIDEYFMDKKNPGCVRKYRLGQTCTEELECMSHVCSKGSCSCRPDHFKDGSLCFDKKLLNTICDNDNECITNNCSQSFCNCVSGYFEEYGTCVKNNWFVTVCHDDATCQIISPNVVCDMNKRKCKCNEKTFFRDLKCLPKKTNGMACLEDDECTGASCVDSKCTCTSGYYQTNFTCLQGKRPNEGCSRIEECHSFDVNSVCNTSTCRCSENYSPNKDMECIPDFMDNIHCQLSGEIVIEEIIGLAINLGNNMTLYYRTFKIIENKIHMILHDRIHRNYVATVLGKKVREKKKISFEIYLADISIAFIPTLIHMLVEEFQIKIPGIGQWISIKHEDVTIKAIKGACLRHIGDNDESTLSLVLISLFALLFLSFVVMAPLVYFFMMGRDSNIAYALPWRHPPAMEQVRPFIPSDTDELRDLCLYLSIIPPPPTTPKKFKIYETGRFGRKKLVEYYLKFFYEQYYDFDYDYTYDYDFDYGSSVDLRRPIPPEYKEFPIREYDPYQRLSYIPYESYSGKWKYQKGSYGDFKKYRSIP